MAVTYIAYDDHLMPTIARDPESINRAGKVLREGGVVAFPTETVYGLGADTFNDAAISRVYELKGRPFDNPLIAHVLDIEQARRIVREWDDRCEALARRFWPGPLTLVAPKHESVPERATAGYATIAVRSPSHEIARALLKEFGGPISAPSANRSGRISPTRAEHVADDFADVADLLILEGGPCQIGIESTVLDLSHDEPRILRPGSVSAEAIGAALGLHVPVGDVGAQAASPGTALQHYAPHTPTELVERSNLTARLAAGADRIALIALHDVQLPPPHLVLRMSADADEYAAGLYEALRRADRSGASLILIEMPEAGVGAGGAMWEAIRNRLRRAASRERSAYDCPPP